MYASTVTVLDAVVENPLLSVAVPVMVNTPGVCSASLVAVFPE